MTINKVLVIGAGTMGAGIAQVFAQSGLNVILNDRAEEFAQKGLDTIQKNLDKAVSKEKISEADKNKALGNIELSTSYESAKDVDLVVEAATENRELKLNIFKEIDDIAPEHAILATNTSSLSIADIATQTKRPDKVIGMHFFNPAHIMKLVEVISAITTSEETQGTITELSKKIGKEPVDVQDSYGFVVNRVLVPMINEAAFLLSEGVATAEGIDNAMKLGANHPIGPLALGDLIGLDVVLAIMSVLNDGFKDPKYRPAPIIKKYVEAGYLGRKTKKGFHSY